MKLFGKKMNKSERDLLLQIAENQVALGKKLDALDKRLEKFEKKQEKSFADVLGGLFILYGKAVMARLNFMELSEGKPISVSANELNEIRNSQSPNPSDKYLILPLDNQVGEVSEKFKKTKKSKLN